MCDDGEISDRQWIHVQLTLHLLTIYSTVLHQLHSCLVPYPPRPHQYHSLLRWHPQSKCKIMLCWWTVDVWLINLWHPCTLANPQGTLSKTKLATFSDTICIPYLSWHWLHVLVLIHCTNNLYNPCQNSPSPCQCMTWWTVDVALSVDCLFYVPIIFRIKMQ